MSSVLPTLMSSSKFYSTQTWRPPWVSHVPAVQSTWRTRRTLGLWRVWLTMTLNGNAMHLAAMAAWHAYVLGNLVKRDPVLLPLAISENDNEDELDVTPSRRQKSR